MCAIPTCCVVIVVCFVLLLMFWPICVCVWVHTKPKTQNLFNLLYSCVTLGQCPGWSTNNPCKNLKSNCELTEVSVHAWSWGCMRASPRVGAGVLPLHAYCYFMACTALLHPCMHSMPCCNYTGKNTRTTTPAHASESSLSLLCPTSTSSNLPG